MITDLYVFCNVLNAFPVSLNLFTLNKFYWSNSYCQIKSNRFYENFRIKLSMASDFKFMTAIYHVTCAFDVVKAHDMAYQANWKAETS